ncbi:MAG: hypothetical protein JWM44_30 [Bacilli bacterium]|nr:hypothetical protein [Bacilli bacterium]
MREKMQSLSIQDGDILFVYGSKKQIEAKFDTELTKMRIKEKDEQEVAAL